MNPNPSVQLEVARFNDNYCPDEVLGQANTFDEIDAGATTWMEVTCGSESYILTYACALEGPGGRVGCTKYEGRSHGRMTTSKGCLI